jgi:hypothetical protein
VALVTSAENDGVNLVPFLEPSGHGAGGHDIGVVRVCRSYQDPLARQRDRRWFSGTHGGCILKPPLDGSVKAFRSWVAPERGWPRCVSRMADSAGSVLCAGLWYEPVRWSRPPGSTSAASRSKQPCPGAGARSQWLRFRRRLTPRY